MIVSLSMVQSEADIIEYFVRCNTKLLDHMFIVLNPSEDGTCEILDALVREGLPITIWPTRKNYYAQSEVLTSLANRIRDQFNPEYLCLLDADEIFLTKNKETFKASLAQIPSDTIGFVPWVTFIPPNNEQQYVFQPDHWEHRLEREVEQYYKAIIPGHAAGGSDIFVPNGQHIVTRSDGRPFKSTILTHLPLAHLPVRSSHQIRMKTCNGILSKGIALGGSWRGTESYQRQTVLSYFETHDSPDIRDVARNYLAREATASDTPEITSDTRLPHDVQLFGALIRQMRPELQLLHRLSYSVFPLPNPTETLRPAALCDDEAKEALPPGTFSSTFYAQNLKCDWPPFAYVSRRFDHSSVLDVGCGLGAYLSLFRTLGAKVVGIDGAPWSNHHFISPNEYIQRDLANTEKLWIDRQFSLSIFVEVAEHLPEEAGLGIIDDIGSKTTDAIVFSAAQLDQPGHGHITLREPGFWLDRFQHCGWGVDVPGSLSLRALSTLHWFRRNLFLLVRKEQPALSELQELLRLGTHRDETGGSRWPTHRPGETIIGFPGEKSAFTMTGDREIAPVPGACIGDSSKDRSSWS